MPAFVEETFDVGHGPSNKRPPLFYFQIPKPIQQLDLKQGIALEIGNAIPEVEAVFAQQDRGRLYVWIVVPDDAEEVFHRVYAKEHEIMDLFDAVDFRFRILASQGNPLAVVMADPNPKLVYSRAK